MRNGVRDTEGLSSWLAYSINPRQLRTALRPAMWGNGQFELMADLDRPCVGMAVCFGLGEGGSRPFKSRSALMTSFPRHEHAKTSSSGVRASPNSPLCLCCQAPLHVHRAEKR